MGGKRRYIDGLLYFFIMCLVSMSLVISSPVFAADDKDKKDKKDNEEEFTLEEIVVTAEKREAEIQKVPMDIAVVRPDDMERLNVHQMTELQKMIPDLETEDVAGNGAVQVKIRGVEINFWNVTAETTVAVSIDGVQLTRANALEGKFYDLERVEMLKGPQGTLYGRGSTAGSLAMISRRPDIGEFGGNIQLEYGSYDRRRIEGALNIPATDKLAFRLSGRKVVRGAYDDINVSTQDMWGGRGSIRWEPNDSQSLNITVDTDSTNNKGGNAFQGIYLKTFGELEIVANDDPNLTDAFREVASGGNVSTPFKAKWYFTGDVSDATTRTDSHGYTINYDHEFEMAWWTVNFGHRASESRSIWYWTSSPGLAPKGTLSNIHSYVAADTMDPVTGEIYPRGSGSQELGQGWYNSYASQQPQTQYYTEDGYDEWGREVSIGDIVPIKEMVVIPGTFRNVRGSVTKTKAHSSQLESRVTSKQAIANGDKIEWLVGASWLNDWVLNDTYVSENAYNDITLQEYALFGQGSYAPFARVNFTAGYRKVWDTKSYTGYKYTGNTVAAGPDNTAYGYAEFEKDHSLFNHYSYDVDYDTYKFNISWQATDTILPFIQYSKGMKTINTDRATGALIPPEQLNSFDAGIKTRLFDGRVQLNLSGYYYYYKNYNEWTTSYQCRIKNYSDPNDTPDDPTDDVFTGCQQIGPTADQDVDYINYVYGILSSGSAKQRGGSANITWVMTPSDRFTLYGSYSHNEYADWDRARAMREMYEPIWGVGNVDSAELPANQTSNRSGQRFGGPWRCNFTYSKMWFIQSDMLTFTTTGQYTGNGRRQVVAQNTEDVHAYPGNPDYLTFDMSFNYSSTKWVPEGYRWSARLYSNNVLDSQALTRRTYNDAYNSQQYKFAPNSGYISGSFVTPRTLGAQITLNF